MTDYVAAYNDPKHVYHAEAKRLAGQLMNDDHCYIKQGIVRWNSNDRVPPADVIELAIHIGFGISRDDHNKARDAETSAFLAAYRANPPQPDMREMRAAFGPGETVVNVVTGQKYRT